MPRKSRKKSESGIYHLMLRGINRQNIFEDNEDRQNLIDTISYYKNLANYQLYGYCLMNNHIHLLMKEEKESISKTVKRISSSYVHWYNKKYGRCGHLFQERFKSESVETEEYFLTVLRYIHKNPIAAGLTKDMEKYSWSSYREYIRVPIYTDVDFALNIFSEEAGIAKKAFDKYMNEKSNDECLDYKERIKISDEKIIDNIRKLGVANISELQYLDKEKRNEMLMQIKDMEGISIRQMERVTGISKSIIHRI